MPRLKLFQVIAPAAGINQEYPPSMIADEETPRAKNVRVRGGVLFKRRGYSTLTSASIASGPVILDGFDRLSGATTAMLATCGGLYRYTGSAWSQIKSGLTGAVDGYHSACVMNDTWIYTNGVDHVQKWTGTGNASDLGGGTDYQTPAYHLCRVVSAFSDRLHLYGTNEDGTSLPFRVRWGELGKIDEFNESQGGGYYDMEGDPTGIQGAVLLGAWNAIYCGQSIWLETYVGGSVVNAFTRVIPNTGTRAPRTIVDLGNEHIFMGADDIYRFDGARVTPIGARIRDDLYKSVARSHHIRCHAALNRDENLYYLYVPYASGDGSITRAYVYDYQQDRWTIDDASYITAAASVAMGTRKTIDELPHLPIDQMPHERIDALGGTAGREYRLFANSSGYIFQDDFQTANDNGVAVDGDWESKDFFLDSDYIDDYKRVQEILIEASGDAVTVSYSTDHGVSWTEATEHTLASEYTRYRSAVDVTCRQIRLRLRNNTSGERFYVKWLGVRYQLAGEY